MTDVLGDRRHWRELAEREGGAWSSRAIRALDRVELLELQKRRMEDDHMRYFIHTMTFARLAFWAESMANAVHNSGIGPAPVQEGKYKIYHLPFPPPKGN